jgi:EAL domain-containing protein (putative c-di-GMP-specific phosphodiesterase class I)
VFDDRLNEKVARRLTLEADLRRAIAEGQLSLAYQPIFDLASRRIKSLEALVRWHHPRAGSISPDLFVRLAEETGQIGALTDWVLENALAQLAEWHRQLPRDRAPTIHVNISGSDLGRTTMAATVQGMLARHGMAPRLLTLEITETTLMGRLADALQCMRQLREIGVRFSIDDFGTGYSSLAYLGTLPIDSLKIDRSFVQGMQQTPHNAEIVRAVQNLGTTLGRGVIAEGIETEAQLQALREMGVTLGQGYVVSRPLAPEAVLDALRPAGAGSEPEPWTESETLALPA